MKLSFSLLFPCLVFLALIFVSCNPAPEADLIFYNGKIFTAADSEQMVEALAVGNGRVIAAGNTATVLSHQASHTHRVDLKGGVVVPGFHDAHLHFWKGALLQAQLNLIGCRDKTEVLEKVKTAVAATPRGEWIIGRGWDHELWPDKQLPSHADLDAISPHHLIYLKRVDGHAAWVNQAVLDLLGYDPETPDPPGGKILRLPHRNQPSGILLDKAYEALDSMIPLPADDSRENILSCAVQYANSLGLTSVTDNSDSRIFQNYARLLQNGQLSLRINFWVDGEQDLDSLRGIFAAFDVDPRWLNARLAKFFADGSMGSRSAYLLAPYDDDHHNPGLPQYGVSEFTGLIRRADEKDWQIGVHAIGDAGNRLVLDAFAGIARENPAPDRRWRIEHAQFVQPEDILRFRELGVIASMQPSHCISDMKWVANRIGDRGRYCYSWRSMLDQGVVLAFGTDWPVEPLNPFLGIYAAVSRQDTLGNPDGGWYPEQRLTVGEAVYAYTAASAYAARSETWLGKLLPGYTADLLLLDRDIFTVSPRELLHTRVLATYVDGRQVFSLIGK